MNQIKRHKLILELIKVKGEVKSKELAETFNVSTMTINRDLKELDKEGLISLVHGGATDLAHTFLESPISVKELEYTHEKELIGKYSKSLISSNSSIFIETGTTTLAVAKEVFSKPNCTFYTNSLLVMNALSKHDDIELYTAPGKYRDLSKGFVGVQTSKYVENLIFDYCIIGTEGLHSEFGVTLIDQDDAYTKKAIMKQSKCTILVVDSSKFGNSFLHKIGDISDFDYIITNDGVDEQTINKLNQQTKVIAVSYKDFL